MMKHIGHLGALLLICTIASATRPLSAQTVQAQNQEILNELKAIRQILETLSSRIAATSGTPAPVNDRVRLTDITGFSIGRADAPLTMVEFTDLQCPYCRQFHLTAYEQIKQDYIDTGKLRYISRDFPIDDLHPLATSAAHAAQCAADQGKFWEMRHLILIGNAQLKPESFAGFAQDLNLDLASFRACAADATVHQVELRKDLLAASSVGITATPTFVVGRTGSSGLDGFRIVGAQSYAVFDTILKGLLSAPPK